MFTSKLYVNGDLLGNYYHFAKIGHGIPMHDHDEETKHNVMVMNGSCQIYGPGKKWSFILKQGAIFDPNDEQIPHEIVALQDNTVIINLFKHGKPAKMKITDEDMGEHIDERELEIPLFIYYNTTA
jgi:hypothetical protein